MQVHGASFFLALREISKSILIFYEMLLGNTKEDLNN